ncbi:MAG: biotin/lipoyl-containing protein [Thermonemataceae bacterium]|nr:biotin/lipoyl-containing protein [Thermonemataceae bacterium]
MLKVTLQDGKEQINFDIDKQESKIILNNELFEADILPLSENKYHIIYRNKSYSIEVLKADATEKNFRLKINGEIYDYTAKTQIDLLLEKMGIQTANTKKVNHIKAPMPGLIVGIKVEIGQKVQKGDILLILEAMKMENVIKSPIEATVKAIKIKQGENVEKNKVLIEFE